MLVIIPTLFSCVFELVGVKETRGTLTFLLGKTSLCTLICIKLAKLSPCKMGVISAASFGFKARFLTLASLSPLKWERQVIQRSQNTGVDGVWWCSPSSCFMSLLNAPPECGSVSLYGQGVWNQWSLCYFEVNGAYIYLPLYYPVLYNQSVPPATKTQGDGMMLRLPTVQILRRAFNLK